MNLRFIERDGKKILQQEHYMSVYFDPKDPVFKVIKPGEKWPTEWRDIPLVKEDEANASS